MPLGRLCAVPQLGAVEDPVRGTLGGDDLGRGDDAAPFRVVVHLASALVDEALAGSVRGTGDGGFALGPLHDGDGVVEEGHGLGLVVLVAAERLGSVVGAGRAVLTGFQVST